jgi:hypothetical protein
MTSRAFIPFRIISDFMFYTFLSPYKIHFDETSGDFGMRTYFGHKVGELVEQNQNENYLRLHHSFISTKFYKLIVAIVHGSVLASRSMEVAVHFFQPRPGDGKVKLPIIIYEAIFDLVHVITMTTFTILIWRRRKNGWTATFRCFFDACSRYKPHTKEQVYPLKVNHSSKITTDFPHES